MLLEIVLIFGCLIVGNYIRILTGISIPGSVFGMIILFILLKTGIIKEKKIKNFANFLTDNMGFFFVPVGVGIALYLDLIKAEIWPIIASASLSTLVILWVVGFASGRK